MNFSDSSNRHIILIFIDGVGIGEPDPAFNPLMFSKNGIFLPDGPDRLVFGGVKVGLDAVLGVTGLPQSATGQTSIYTGINAAGIIGHHLFGFPNQPLRDLLHHDSLFVRLVAKGKKCRFLNGFRPVFFSTPEIFARMRMSATAEMNRGAGLPFTSLDDIREGRGIYHEYTNQFLNNLGFSMPSFTASDAADIIVAESRKYHLILYEYFMTDAAGHSRDLAFGKREVRMIEQLIFGVASRINREDTVLMVISDHGNLEDLRTKSHTLNLSYFALWGNDIPVSDLRKITDVTPMILDLLS
jgi:2,3-bisphosphoglycerate-independent phosphoglycerate mutase